LQTALQEAIQVELTTIPAYLYAMYSITDESSEANAYIFSVVVEEMLHLSLASNLLVSVGGQPKFYDPSIVPTYPGPLPHHKAGLTVNLEKCDASALSVFLQIEQPETSGAPPESDDFDTIGQFYAAVADAFTTLSGQGDLFADNVVGKQLTSSDAYFPQPYDSADSGGLIAVTDLASAQQAIQYIVQQGEGIQQEQYDDPSKTELAHYYKFKQIADDPSIIGAVANVVTNPTAAGFGGNLSGLADLLNASYSYLLLTIENIFATADPTEKGDLVKNGLMVIMPSLISPLANLLVQQPVGDETPTRYAGPPFQYYDFTASPQTPLQQLQSLYEKVAADYPSLSLGDTIAALPEVSLSR
jgi:hypothetical protein